MEETKSISEFDSWHKKHSDLLAGSREDSVQSHVRSGKPIPIWVASEAWNFGTLSKLYSMLSGANQQMICDRLGIDKRQTLDNWVINLNGIRNRCAHHSRVCNRPNIRTLVMPRAGYFNLLSLNQAACNKLYGFIAVVWYLLLKIAPGSDWIRRIADLLDGIPRVNGFSYKSMGLPETGFPRGLFPCTAKPVEDVGILEQIINSRSQLARVSNALKANIPLNDVSELLEGFGQELLNLAVQIEDIER